MAEQVCELVAGRGALARAVGAPEVVGTGRGYVGAHRAWGRDQRKGLQLDITAHDLRTYCGTRYGSQ